MFAHLGSWLARTPVQTFLLCPAAVIAFELGLHTGRLTVVPWGGLLLAWGYLQYRLVGRYRTRQGGGGPGIQVAPERLVTSGPYRFVRNPMYLGHLIFVLGLALTFWSAFALVLLAARTIWFQRRVIDDEARLAAVFGGKYEAYCSQASRWIPLVRSRNGLTRADRHNRAGV